MKVRKHIPILNWLPKYKRSFLVGDFSAGVTVGVMLIPQGMAYAMIAGLPPVYGLYAAIFPQLVYSIFGTSRQLAVGPVAMDSLLVAAGISTIAISGSENYISLAILLALMMGSIQFLFGVFRLGFLVNFLSKPVISGFTSAAAIIIAINQFKYLLGIDLERGQNVFRIVYEVFEKFDSINLLSIVIGLITIFIIVVSKKIHRSIPSALVVVLLGVWVSWFFNLNSLGTQIVGEIPAGLPSFKLPEFGFDQFKELLPIAFTLAIIAFMEAISIAKALEVKHKGEYELDNNQEMISLGLSNIVGSFFMSYPTTGGFGRSAVNNESGAKTNFSAIISALIISIVLMYFTSVFYFLPKSVLGGVIIVAVVGLIDFSYPILLLKIKRQDFYMLLLTFLVTLTIGIKEGVIAGVLISLFILIYRTARPHIAVLGKLPKTNDYRNVKRFSEIEVRDDVLVVRHDAQLYFANIDNFISTLKLEIERKPKLKLLVLHCGSVSSIDSTALDQIKELISELSERNIGVAFSGLIGPVRDFLFKAGFIQELGVDHFFIDVQSAIDLFDGDSNFLTHKYSSRALQNNVFKEKDI